MAFPTAICTRETLDTKDGERVTETVAFVGGTEVLIYTMF